MKKQNNRKNKKYSEIKRAIENFKINIITNKNNIDYLGSVKKQVPVTYYQELINWIISDGVGHAKFGKIFPTLYSELYRYIVVNKINISDELLWVFTYLNDYKDKINIFVSLSNKFYTLLLLGEYDLAEKKLTEIESIFGKSLWLIKTKIAFTQKAKGLEAQKEYTKDVIESGCRNGFLAFLTHEFSIAVEPAVTMGSFSDRINDIMSQYNLPSSMSSFINYHLLISFDITRDQINDILRMESTGSIIDLYETVVNMGLISVVKNYNDLNCLFSEYFEKINVCDDRVKYIMWLVAKGDPPSFDSNGASLSYLNGDFIKAFEQSYIGLRDNPIAVNLIDIAARSSAILNIDIPDDKTPIMEIVSSLKNTLMYRSDEESYSKNIFKFALSFAPSGWASFLCAFILRQLSCVPNYSVEGLLTLGVISCGEIGCLTPRYMASSGYAKKFNQFCANCEHYNLEKCFIDGALSGNCDECSSVESLYSCIVYNIENNNYDIASKFSSCLIQNDNIYYRLRGYRSKSYSLYRMGDIESCIKLIVDVLCENINYLNLFPLKDVAESLGADFLKKKSHMIEIPILYDMYQKKYSGKYEHLRRYSFLDYVESTGSKKPSQIINNSAHIQRNVLIYFLYNLCVEHNMDLTFSGSEQVAKERADICKYLAEIDSENINIYQSEIKDIYRKLIVKSKAQDVEKSKIYVDLTSLKMEARKVLKEKFDRYKAYLAEGLDEKSFEYMRKIKEAVREGFSRSFFDFAAPENEMTSIASSLIVGLRDLFVSNSHHGLDGYLCVRIRHGTLLAKLRGPLEAENLITRIDSQTKKYKENKELIALIGATDERLIKAISKCFDDFSIKYDKLLMKINKEWIQVKTKNDDVGLFDLTLYNLHIGLLTAHVTQDTTFEEFVDYVFDVFFNKLEHSLKHIRYKIQYEAKEEAISLVSDLAKNIASYSSDINISDIICSINSARTRLQFAFDRVTEWFNLYQTAEKQPFKIEEAIEIGKESIKTFCPQFKVNLFDNKSLCDTYISGSLASFVDIVFNIFENSVKYAGFDDGICVNISLDSGLDYISIDFKNPVAAGVYDATIDKVTQLASKIQKSKEDLLLCTEGGTGFYKIMKILKHDFNFSRTQDPILDFGFYDEFCFHVNIKIYQ